MSSTKDKTSNIKAVTTQPSIPDQNQVEGPSEITETGIRNMSGRIVRPSTAEVRHEVMRLSKETGLSEFEHGVKTALEWILGDRKTLRRSDK
jgi:hypothetical protein